MNYDNVRSSNAFGQAKFELWKSRWATEFFRPLAEDQLRATIAVMPKEVIDQYTQMDPELFNSVVDKLGGRNG